MSRVKQASKQKRRTKAAAVKMLGAAGLSFSLVGNASASTMPTVGVPLSDNTSPNQRFVLSDEEMADVSLATFHVFDGNTQAGACSWPVDADAVVAAMVAGAAAAVVAAASGWVAEVAPSPAVAAAAAAVAFGGVWIGACAVACAGCAVGACCASWGACRLC